MTATSTSTAGGFGTASWPITGYSGEPLRYLRVRSTGDNSDGWQNVAVGGFEVYGTLHDAEPAEESAGGAAAAAAAAAVTPGGRRRTRRKKRKRRRKKSRKRRRKKSHKKRRRINQAEKAQNTSKKINQR